MLTLREEVAKERFLDMCAQNKGIVIEVIAASAVKQADALVAALGAQAASLPRPVMKGCKSCFGSGGKTNQPCRDCKGTGKVRVI